MRKIEAGAIPHLRLSLPNQRSRSVFRRRGGYQPPASLPPLRGKVPSGCEADEGGLRNHRGPCDEPAHPVGAAHWAARRHAGPVWDRPLRKDRRVSGYSVGAGVLTRPPIALTPWCLFGFFLGPQKETRRRGGAPPPINETALSSSPHPSGLRPATFPPGGRLKSRRRRKPLRFKNQLSCKSCFSSASRFRASMGDKMFTSVIRSF